MTIPRAVVSLLLALGLAAACRGPAFDVLGTYDGGSFTVSDLDAFVRALPEAQRIVPDATHPAAWLEDRARSLAVERVLEQSAAVQQQLVSSETLARRRWAIAGKVASAVMQNLVAAARPTDAAVQARMSTLGNRRPQPVYDFRHIFLRLDRAAEVSGERAVRQLAAHVQHRAQQGEDFAELARQYSQSSTGLAGGLVEKQRPAHLEAAVLEAIAKLAEGEVSPIVESRTGLHIFRLERKLTPQPWSREQRAAQVLELLSREAAVAARASLITELRQRFEVATDDFPWRVGRFEVSSVDLELMADLWSVAGSQRQLLVDQLLLAEEGVRRGLRTVELDAEVDRQLRSEAIRAAYLARRAAVVAATPVDRLRPIYDARPAAFAEPQTAHLDLIFVPQGGDAFATQRRIESHVAELRGGASFAELARRISSGPGAEAGGDLGLLPPSEWARLGPEIYKTVVAMETGAIAGPVYQTDRLLTNDPRTLRGGFAILRVRARNPPRERMFEASIDMLRATWARQNGAELDHAVRAGILADAGFELIRLPTPDELDR